MWSFSTPRRREILMLLIPGRFGILLAHDAHMPGGVLAEPEPIVKVVFKVRLTGT